MKTTKIQFNGRSYYSRIVESVDGEELLIGSTILLDALQPGSSMTRTKVLPVKKPKGFMTRFSSLPTREPASASRKRVDRPNPKRITPIGSSKVME